MESWTQYIRHVVLLTFVLFIAACAPKERAISKTEMPENLMEDIRAFTVANPTNRILQAEKLADSFQCFVETCKLQKCYVSQDVVVEALGKDFRREFSAVDEIDYLVFRKFDARNSPRKIINFRFHKGKLTKVVIFYGRP
jgi:hypothetical protein